MPRHPRRCCDSGSAKPNGEESGGGSESARLQDQVRGRFGHSTTGRASAKRYSSSSNARSRRRKREAALPRRALCPLARVACAPAAHTRGRPCLVRARCGTARGRAPRSAELVAVCVCCAAGLVPEFVFISAGHTHSDTHAPTHSAQWHRTSNDTATARRRARATTRRTPLAQHTVTAIAAASARVALAVRTATGTVAPRRRRRHCRACGAN